MPIGRARYEPDDMEEARRDLIRRLRHAEGEDLVRAIEEGKRYNRTFPLDDVVEDALKLAKTRLRESET